MARDQAVVVYLPNEPGGRLAYYADEADSEYWDRQYDREEMDYSRYERGHLPRFLRRTFLRHVPKGSRVLEAGSGQAWFTVAADALGYQAEGIDYAPRVVARLNEHYPNLKITEGDVRHLAGVPDGTYDAVFSPGVCEHFEDGPEPVLREAHRITKHGGIVFVSTPCLNPFRRLLAQIGWFDHPIPKGTPFYQYAFSNREMTAILDGIGFDVVAVDRHSVHRTLTDLDRRVRRLPLLGPLSYALEAIPPIRQFMGHSCVWVARKR